MLPFRVLEHMADVGFEAFGATREQLFANAGRALFHLIVDPDAVEAREQVSLALEARETTELLVDWLSEILYLWDAEGWLFCNFGMHKLTDRSLSADARGERFDPVRHPIKLLVKAITYHQLALERNPEGWRCRVYVDV